MDWWYPSRLAGEVASLRVAKRRWCWWPSRSGGELPPGARMTVIPDFRKETLLGFLKDNVEPSSTVYTDQNILLKSGLDKEYSFAFNITKRI